MLDIRFNDYNKITAIHSYVVCEEFIMRVKKIKNLDSSIKNLLIIVYLVENSNKEKEKYEFKYVDKRSFFINLYINIDELKDIQTEDEIHNKQLEWIENSLQFVCNYYSLDFLPFQIICQEIRATKFKFIWRYTRKQVYYAQNRQHRIQFYSLPRLKNIDYYFIIQKKENKEYITICNELLYKGDYNTMAGGLLFNKAYWVDNEQFEIQSIFSALTTKIKVDGEFTMEFNEEVKNDFIKEVLITSFNGTRDDFNTFYENKIPDVKDVTFVPITPLFSNV